MIRRAIFAHALLFGPACLPSFTLAECYSDLDCRDEAGAGGRTCSAERRCVAIMAPNDGGSAMDAGDPSCPRLDRPDAAPDAAPSWRLFDTTGPTVGDRFSLAYDERLDELVLYGGINGNDNETWTQTSPCGQWRPRTTQTFMPSRYDHSAVYDPSTQTTVLFGGVLGPYGGEPPPTPSDETWSWDGEDWTQLHPTTAPERRRLFAMSYSPGRGVLIFGGYGDDMSVIYGDTWAFDAQHVSWQHLDLTPSPEPRSSAVMAYEPKLGGTVLFGGLSATTELSDTWLLTDTATAWRKLSEGAPGIRQASMMAYDPDLEALILFGGVRKVPFAHLDETWARTMGGWMQLHPARPPNGRKTGGMVYDRARRAILLRGGFPGLPGDPLGAHDTWLLY